MQRMGQTALLLMRTKEFDVSITELKDALKTAKYDIVISAVKSCCKFQDDKGTTNKVAGLPMKMGYNIEKYGQILIDRSPKTGDKFLQKDTKLPEESNTTRRRKILPLRPSTLLNNKLTLNLLCFL